MILTHIILIDKMLFYYLYAIIFIEGYVVLSTEIIAIRQIIPFVGNGAEVVSIIIASVLMPLSLGYYVGGNFTKNKRFHIRQKLMLNLVIASLILTIGLSYIFLDVFFPFLEQYYVNHRVLKTIIFSLLFLIIPAFLLGQTVPLISHYFAKMHRSKITGVILCISTIGSFCGSILSTLLLMPLIGVHHVIIMNIFLLFIIYVILSRKKIVISTMVMFLILSLAVALNSSYAMKYLRIVEDNAYNTIVVGHYHDDENVRMININRSVSALLTKDPRQRYDYLQYIEQQFINLSLDQQSPPKSILIIGAGGFTLGYQDYYNHYQFVDIDKSLKRVAQTYFLQRDLKPNQQFIPIPARAFFRQNKEQYDLIILDAYSNANSTPGQLITKEYFMQVKNHIKSGGAMVLFVVASGNLHDKFSVKLDRTVRQVFGFVNRHPLDQFNPWYNKREGGLLYIYYNN